MLFSIHPIVFANCKETTVQEFIIETSNGGIVGSETVIVCHNARQEKPIGGIGGAIVSVQVGVNFYVGKNTTSGKYGGWANTGGNFQPRRERISKEPPIVRPDVLCDCFPGILDVKCYSRRVSSEEEAVRNECNIWPKINVGSVSVIPDLNTANYYHEKGEKHEEQLTGIFNQSLPERFVGWLGAIFFWIVGSILFTAFCWRGNSNRQYALYFSGGVFSLVACFSCLHLAGIY